MPPPPQFAGCCERCADPGPLPRDATTVALSFLPAQELATAQRVCVAWRACSRRRLRGIRAGLGALRASVARRVSELYKEVQEIEMGLWPASMRRAVDGAVHVRAEHALRCLSLWAQTASSHGVSPKDEGLAHCALVLSCAESAAAPGAGATAGAGAGGGWALLLR